MKAVYLLYFVTVLLAGSAQAQAPATLAGLTYRDDAMGGYQSPGGLMTTRMITVIDFLADQTYAERFSIPFFADVLNLDLHPPLPYYASPGLSGLSSYTKLSPSSASVTLLTFTGESAVPNVLTLVFTDATHGTVSRTAFGTAATGNFSLLPTADTGSTQSLVNISTLVPVRRGSAVAIGFVVGGTAMREFLIRAVGPSLTALGVANAAANPIYLLNGADAVKYMPGEGANFGGGMVFAPVGWSATPTALAVLNAESSRVGAFPLTSGSNDKADIFLLPPGAYSITVAPTDASAEGMELVEVYEVP